MSILERARRGAATALLYHLIRTGLAGLIALELSAPLANLAPPLDAYEASQWLSSLLQASRTHALTVGGCALALVAIEPLLAWLWLRAMASPDERTRGSVVRGYLRTVAVSISVLLPSAMGLLVVLWAGAAAGRWLPPTAWLEDLFRLLPALGGAAIWLLASTAHDLARAAAATGLARPMHALALAFRRLSLRLLTARLASALAVLLLLAVGEALGRYVQGSSVTLAALAAQQVAAAAALVPRALWLAVAVDATRR